MKSAHKVTEIQFGYAEGWKALNEDMSIFISILLILISILLLPLLGTDPKSNMKELYQTAKYGKIPLDHARIAIAFIIGAFLYISGILLFVVSLLRLITVFMVKVMTSVVVFVFFWILLLLFDRLYLWPVNHYFANFMPLRMTSFTHYYAGKSKMSSVKTCSHCIFLKSHAEV